MPDAVTQPRFDTTVPLFLHPETQIEHVSLKQAVSISADGEAGGKDTPSLISPRTVCIIGPSVPVGATSLASHRPTLEMHSR